MRRKIFVVTQSSEKDCGPACLLSIIKYYGGFVPLEKIKIDAKTSLIGTTAYELIRAANSYGLDGIGKKLNEENLISEQRTFPFIAQVRVRKYEHYVVVYEIFKNKVVLMDPAVGKKTISISEFLEISTGIVIEFYKRSTVLIMTKDSKIFDLFINIVKLEKILLFKIIICSFMLTLSTVITSFYFKVSVENLNSDTSVLKIIVLFFLIMTLFKVALTKVRVSYQTHLNKNLIIRLYQEFFEHLFLLPSNNLENKSVGEIVTRINDLGNVKNVFSEIVVSVFLDVILTLIAIPLLIYINAYLFIILFCMLILYFIVGVIFSKCLYKKIVYNKECESIYNTTVIENITMFKNIKNLGKTKKALKKIEYSISNYIYSGFKIEMFYNAESSIKNLINEVGYFIVNTIGIYLIYINSLSVTDLVTFNTLMSFFLTPIQSLIGNIPKYNYIRASIYKLNEFMSMEKEETKSVGKISSYSITFKNVFFSYNDIDSILENINFSIKENEHVFIKGKSGGGKSTILKLIVKNNIVETGEILIGRNNINDLSLATIRSNIVYISQKEYLFTDTIRENILFFNEIDNEKFTLICEICKIDMLLKNKKMRYDSFVEMDANNFSGGEKQRIILARALINEFNVLIIDEALSEVDYFTEVSIISNLRKYFSDKTIIYVSHKKLEKYFGKVINIDKTKL